jgi:hypothetical protein
MSNSLQRIFYLAAGTIALLFAVYSFTNPSLCESGCGNLTEPIFTFSYWAFGPWGPRVLLLLVAFFFFWAAGKAREK